MSSESVISSDSNQDDIEMQKARVVISAEPLAEFDRLMERGKYGSAVMEYYRLKGLSLSPRDRKLLDANSSRSSRLSIKEIRELADLAHLDLKGVPYLKNKASRLPEGIKTVERGLKHFKFVKNKDAISAATIMVYAVAGAALLYGVTTSYNLVVEFFKRG